MIEYLLVIDYSIFSSNVHVFKIEREDVDVETFLKNNKIDYNYCQWWFTTSIPKFIKHD